MAKYHNAYGEVDQIMQSLARLTLKMPDKTFSRKLEHLLNSEIAITVPKQSTAASAYEGTVHPGILAQADFVYLTAGEKLKRV